MKSLFAFLVVSLVLLPPSAAPGQATSGGAASSAGGPTFLPPRASATLRNGLGINPTSYSVQAPPVLGATYQATVQTTNGGLGVFVVGFLSPHSQRTGFGEVLVHPLSAGGELLGSNTGPYLFAGGVASIGIPVPNDPLLSGFKLKTQAIEIGGGIQLTNAQDLVFGT